MWTEQTTGPILLRVDDSGILGGLTTDKGGRPKVGPRRDIRLSDEDWALLRQAGGGQAARGLRAILALYRRRLARIEARARRHAD